MRTRNASLNMIVDLCGQILTLGLNFVLRSILIQSLGVTYLGLQGLFVNIISILSMAELGIGTAITYNLYKPIENNDEYKISALMNMYKTAYRYIATSIFGLSIILTPFLPNIVKGYNETKGLYLIYLIYILNTVFSYLFVYKRSIIVANQKAYIVNIIDYLFMIITVVVQGFILIRLKNFIFYIIAEGVIKITKNIVISIVADKLYPFMSKMRGAKVSDLDKKHFFENIKALFLYKIGGTIIDSTDNVVISSFLGLSSVGIYSGYSLIISSLKVLISRMFNSLTSSVGNLNINESHEKKYFIFRTLELITFYIYFIVSICIFQLINPFINIWIGNEFLFEKSIVFILVINFYMAGMLVPIGVYRNACGLFVQGKYRPIIASILNIVISIWLVKPMGIIGVFIGTFISRALVTCWFDPYVIYKNVFNKSLIYYFISYAKYLFVLAIGMLFSCGLNFILPHNTFMQIIIKAICIIIILTIVFIICFFRSEEFKYMSVIVKNLYSKLGFKKKLN